METAPYNSSSAKLVPMAFREGNSNKSTMAPFVYQDELIHELDTIFDIIHGGRAARYSAQ